MSESKGDILVVDDTPAYLEALRGMLTAEGYRVRPVTRGSLALKAVEAARPDLVLLDINMPEMDGFETCRRLKADPRFAETPVIFLSALSETDDKVRAFESGGVDYVTKPFQAAEVLARVETHLRVDRLRRQIAEQFDALKRLEALRDSLTHMIVHDLRAPLQGIFAHLQLLELDAADLQEGQRDSVAEALKSTRSLIQMVSAVLDVSRLEAGEMPLDRAETDLSGAVEDALQTLGGLLAGRTFRVEYPEGPVRAILDRGVIARVVANLVGNALKFTPEDGSIVVRTGRREGVVRVEVVDTGSGIPPEYRSKIFEKFGQVESGKRNVLSTGLGLAFCKLAVEAHGGTIGVDSPAGGGSVFWFTVP